MIGFEQVKLATKIDWRSDMFLHTISVKHYKKTYNFDVGEYPHHDQLRCKFNVYYQGKLVASFAPDRQHLLQLCKNYGNLREPLLNLIADKIEQLYPHGFFVR
jgi:hypothetical protein